MENLNPQVMRILGKEIQSLKVEPLEGISVLLDDQDITKVEAIIDGPSDTPYYGGRFRIKLTIGKDFPQGPPKGFFLTKIFHPNVSSKGEIVSKITGVKRHKSLPFQGAIFIHLLGLSSEYISNIFPDFSVLIR